MQQSTLLDLVSTAYADADTVAKRRWLSPKKFGNAAAFAASAENKDANNNNNNDDNDDVGSGGAETTENEFTRVSIGVEDVWNIAGVVSFIRGALSARELVGPASGLHLATPHDHFPPVHPAVQLQRRFQRQRLKARDAPCLGDG